MKVLLAHSHYGSSAPSGENRVFELERNLLIEAGHDVRCIEKYGDNLRDKGLRGLVIGAAVTPWNPFTANEMRRAVAEFRPDIVHVHNSFPILSPAVLPAAQGTARVLTLHNYRLGCAAGIPMRDGGVCTKCLDRRSVLPALRYGCYRGSRLATLPLAAKISLHRRRGTWQSDVEAFIALTAFQAGVMVNMGFPSDRMHIKPNFYPNSPAFQPYDARPDRVVFVGRVSEEKGVVDLIEAWIGWEQQQIQSPPPAFPELRVIGGGPLLEQLRNRAKQSPSIRFLGQLSSSDTQREIAAARLLVLPSRWFEGFPMVLPEAFAFGTPVLVSEIGPLPALANESGGETFKTGDPTSLKSALSRIWSRRDQLKIASLKAHTCFTSKYTASSNYSTLLDIYHKAIETRIKMQKNNE